jgi:hypothetical protein
MAHEINHTDFEPKMVKKSFWGVKTYESTELVMEQVNEWTRKNYNREIINVETLVFPNSTDNLKKGNTSRLHLQGGYVYLIQIIRVWYK